MTQPNPSRIKTGGGADLAFAVVVLASYFTTFSAMKEAPLMHIGLMSALGITYVSVGIYGYAFCARSNSLALQLAYFGIQAPLGGWIVYLSQATGFNAMILLPLAGHSVVLLPRFWVAVVNLGVVAAYLIPGFSFGGGWLSVWQGLQVFLAGQIFVVAFTQMAVNEERGRLEVERLAQDLSSANQRLREYAGQIGELATIRERNRLAREIHDGLGHYLTTIYMQIQAAQAVMPRSPDGAQKAMQTAAELAQKALADVRHSVSTLRSAPEENLPLSQSIPRILEFCETVSIAPSFEMRGQERSLSPQAQLTLYRAAQEGVSNACKHARASRLEVTLDFTERERVTLSIQDDGVGSADTGGGFGLVGLEERAHLLGGEFRIRTSPGQGFRFELEVPE